MRGLAILLGAVAIPGTLSLAQQANEIEARIMGTLGNNSSYKVTGPPISVVIPSYIEEDYIENTLQGIRRQSYEPVEIVISDTSPEDSKARIGEIANRYGAIMVNAPKKNVSYGRNVGAENATGEILIFLDADCVMAEDFTERIVKALQNGAKLAHGVDIFYETSPIRNVGKIISSKFKSLGTTTGRGIGMRKEDFFEVGGYDENIDPMNPYGREDIDLGRRVIQRWGLDSIVLDKQAFVAEACRRPWGSTLGATPWKERGWRKGEAVSMWRREL